MKKVFPLLVSVMALCFAACTESSYEYHQTYFYPQQPGGKMMYADQTLDTTRVISYDSWTAQTTADWLLLTPTEQHIPAGYGMNTLVKLTCAPNTTGQTRHAAILLKSFDSLAMDVYQTAWLNIIWPSPVYINKPEAVGDASTGTIMDKQVSFMTTLSADTTSMKVKFRVYADGATLQSDAAWLVQKDTVYAAGTHEALLSVEPNASAAPRTATLTLSSNGVSTPIKVTQKEKQQQ